MNVRELKNEIENNSLSDAPLILKYSDNKFICTQYIEAICRNKNLYKSYISSINDIPHDDLLFDDLPKILYIIDVDKFIENLTPDMKNIIILCKTVAPNLSIDYIEIPKLINWQIEDYVQMRLPGLLKSQISWLCEIAKYDIYRLNQECEKLEIFPKGTQKVIFDELNQNNAYRDLNSLTIFNFINAIMKKDMSTIQEVLTDLDYIDVEPTGVVTLLLKNFKKLIEATTYAKWNDTLTCSTKEFYFYKNNLTQYYKRDSLPDIYEFLTSIDCRLKSGMLDFSKPAFVNYIAVNILTK